MIRKLTICAILLAAFAPLTMADTELELEKAKNDYELAEKNLKKAKSEWKECKKYKEAALNDAIQGLEKDVAVLEAKRDAVDKGLKSLRDTIAMNHAKIAAKQQELAELQAYEAQLEANKESVMLRKAEAVEAKLGKPFSQINLNELNSAAAQLAPYKNKPEIGAILTKINNAIRTKQDFDQKTQTMYKSQANAKAGADYLQAMARNNNLSPEQQKECAELADGMKEYPAAVKGFQGIIKGVNLVRNKAAEFPNDVMVSNLKSQVFDSDRGKAYVVPINKIPYLKAKYEEYKRWALSSPKTQTPDIEAIEKEINTMKITE